MTSEIDALKTNEFLHRRKLRLQQVREQSKEIAKKIRQRAKVEKLRQVRDIDTKKEKEFQECKKTLVNRLQQLYIKGLDNVGESHKSACEQNEQKLKENVDRSKSRGREAVAELRRTKQKVLDDQKKLLDRKLQAREAANEKSREKAGIISKSFHKKGATDEDILESENLVNRHNLKKSNLETVTRVDMATQAEFDDQLNRFGPDIPILTIPEDDDGIVKDTINDDEVDKSDKSKRFNLFALSDEMPSSLRGGLSSITTEKVPFKPTLTLVSEYIQNRDLRLRQNDTKSNKKPIEDLQSIKQTIMRSRASKPEDRRCNTEKSFKSSAVDSGLTGKCSVTMYNHSTRDVRTIPCNDEELVVRDNIHIDDDAYSKAQKEVSNDDIKQKELNEKIADRRNRVAMTKQNIDKEYKETLAFLNSLPKDMSSKPVKEAYMDEKRQQMLKDNHQKKLEQEFKNMEKECIKNRCKHSKSHKTSKSTSPNVKSAKNFSARNFQYSWMPVPERESNLAVHTIPTTVKECKQANTVKFSEIDSYHEYRSRHRHTPPTKDTCKRFVEKVVIHNNGKESTGCSSITSDSSSAESIILDNKEKMKQVSEENDSKLSDADRIIIYKILESKNHKKHKCNRKSKSLKNVDKFINNKEIIDQLLECLKARKAEQKNVETDNNDNIVNIEAFEQIKEGIYKAVKENGDNMTTLNFPENPQEPQYNIPSETGNSHAYCHETTKNKIGTNGSCLTTTRQSQNRSKCDVSNIARDVQANQLSATTSTSSFKTAPNEKSPSALHEGAFVKLDDEGSQETKKIFVGATGFLKDDDFEVVIQLRKKEINKIDDIRNADEKNKSENPIVRETISDNKTLTTNDTTENLIENKMCLDQVSAINLETHNVVTENHESSKPKEDVTITAKDLTSNKKVDKSLQVSCSNSFSVACSESIPTKTTATYTQTISSPIQRPMFMHMSSSTSTAYMSPPELILPKFIRRDYSVSYDEIYDSVSNEHPIRHQHEHLYNQYDDRKRCTHSKIKSHHHRQVLNRKVNYEYKNAATPPNTARSVQPHSDSSMQNSLRTFESTDKKICTCKHHKVLKCCKYANTKVFSNIHNDSKSSCKHTSASKTKACKRSMKSELNPMIKNYVNKLLNLNREGIKAVEVINEECSSVATPSSSIINVPFNINEKSSMTKQISLEQIKDLLKQKIIDDYKDKENEIFNQNMMEYELNKINNKSKFRKRKQLHKIKSLNISRKFSKSKGRVNSEKSINQFRSCKTTSSSSSLKNTYNSRSFSTTSRAIKLNKNNSPPHPIIDIDLQRKKYESITKSQKIAELCTSQKSTATHTSTDSENIGVSNSHHKEAQQATHISTQTSGNYDSDNFMKIAEGKLQNMEKIADLTEKCTKRLSNLARVLEEVRKNKSTAYSHISTSESSSDSDFDRNRKDFLNKPPTPIFDKSSEEQKIVKKPSHNILDQKEIHCVKSNNFVPFLTNLPKPATFKTPHPVSLTEQPIKESPKFETNIESENPHWKLKCKPPTSLSRINLKHEQLYNIPHELSTVLEVDSPMSLKLKSQSNNNINTDLQNNTVKSIDNNEKGDINKTPNNISDIIKETVDPDILQSNISKFRKISQMLDYSPNDSKLQMMDLKQFNEIMLKPFISIQEYTNKHNIKALEEDSNTDEKFKDDVGNGNEELSSINSDSSLPDVIAELLKRNLINEPFKFDTPSNVNSSTISSESTISVLALSKVRKDKKKTSAISQNKKKVSETSDTLSISSNPDLENAFQKLGMGWASSTLKKTKERLALSSSSNTSSSSMTINPFKNLSNPPPSSDSGSSLIAFKSPRIESNILEINKDAEQQTCLSNSMTVKEFLTNELAKRITFKNKSTKDETEQEFVSLYETKVPEQMKQNIHEEDQSGNSVTSGNNRARTSTPVQVFRSMTYHSSSSSNSNGLFSNADISSVKVTSTSIRNHSTSKDDLTIPNYSLQVKKGLSDCSKSD